MTEGTRIGKVQEGEDLSQTPIQINAADKLESTKLGEISEFERSIYSDEELNHRYQADPQSIDLDFQEEMNKSLVEIKEGEIVTGHVRYLEKSGVFVDINYKSDGYLPNAEFSFNPNLIPTQILNPGDEIKVYIEKLESKEGYSILSCKRAEFEEAWNVLVKSYKTRVPIEVHVDSKVQGGLVATFQNMIKGFMPASQVLKESEESLDGYIGKNIDVLVIQADRKRKKVVFSNRTLKTRAQRESREKALEALEVGQVKTGLVSSIKDFGIFVDLGGIEGLVHISEMSWSRIQKPSDMVAVGDEVQVFILGVDRDECRVSLGMKQLLEDPWVSVAERYSIGQVVKGLVTRTATFGAFIEIEKGVEGLAHISELSLERVKAVEDVVKAGDLVESMVIKLTPEKQRIALSIKQLKINKESSTQLESSEEPLVELETQNEEAAG